MRKRASIVPTVEKVQQLPQLPWSLTGVTALKCLQSQLVGISLRIEEVAFSGEISGLNVAEHSYVSPTML